MAVSLITPLRIAKAAGQNFLATAAAFVHGLEDVQGSKAVSEMGTFAAQGVALIHKLPATAATLALAEKLPAVIPKIAKEELTATAFKERMLAAITPGTG